MREALAGSRNRPVAELVRWWLLATGGAGLLLDADGGLAGLDDFCSRTWTPRSDALPKTGWRAVFVLTDFLWFAAARVVNGVQLGGRRGAGTPQGAATGSSSMPCSHRSHELCERACDRPAGTC